MDFDVIAISRTLGAGGEKLGEILADELEIGRAHV